MLKKGNRLLKTNDQLKGVCTVKIFHFITSNSNQSFKCLSVFACVCASANCCQLSSNLFIFDFVVHFLLSVSIHIQTANRFGLMPDNILFRFALNCSCITISYYYKLSSVVVIHPRGSINEQKTLIYQNIFCISFFYFI